SPADGPTGDRDRRVHEVSIVVAMTHTNFRDLTGAASHGILMTLRAGRGVKDRSQTQAGIFSLFEDLLIAREGVSNRLRDAVARALGAGVQRLQCGRIESRGSFLCNLVSKEKDRPTNRHEHEKKTDGPRHHFQNLHNLQWTTTRLKPVANYS